MTENEVRILLHLNKVRSQNNVTHILAEALQMTEHDVLSAVDLLLAKEYIYEDSTPNQLAEGLRAWKIKSPNGETKVDQIQKGFDSVKNKRSLRTKIKSFFYDPWTITIGGGLIVLFVSVPFSVSTFEESNTDFQKPHFEIQNYKIIINNESFPAIDSIRITTKYQGSKVILNKNLNLLSYEFTDDQYFYSDPNFPSRPELEILESILQTTVLDSVNPSGNIIVQLKRKSIFDGVDVARFDKEDKKVIGNLALELSYNYKNKLVHDTLYTPIYIVKEYEP